MYFSVKLVLFPQYNSQTLDPLCRTVTPDSWYDNAVIHFMCAEREIDQEFKLPSTFSVNKVSVFLKFLNLKSLSLTLVLCLFQAGKFDMVPTLINLVAAFTSIGLVGISALRILQFLSCILPSF